MSMTPTVWRSLLMIFWITGLLAAPAFGNDDGAPPSCLSVSDFRYKGAFRLPGGDDSGWGYGGGAMAWYPYGDPGGPSDGHPGSLFAAGYNVENRIAEISIPAPVISASKNPADLNTAVLLQGFADLKGSLSKVLDTPPQYAGIAWLPAMGDQAGGKLYLAFGQHFQEFEASHLWCNVSLSAPDITGPWQFGGYANYVTNDYLLPIPESFADAYLFGRRLGSGRHREGVWGGFGPTLFAAAPWQDGNPPNESTNLSTVVPLLLYGEQIPGIPEMQIDETWKMDGYSEADYWSGAAWLTAGSKSAVAFIGTKAMGESWYGFANGVVWDYDCAASGTCPDVPDWPYDSRGYWADGYQARIILYNPADMAAVARGTKQTWEPQPYAVIDLTSRLFDPDIDVMRYRRHLVGAMAFDDVNGFLYFFELLADGDKPVVHVFELDASSPQDDGNDDDDGFGDDPDDSDGTDPGDDDPGPGDDGDSGDHDGDYAGNNDDADGDDNGEDDGSGDDGDDDDHAGSGGGSGGGCFIHAVW